MRADIVRHLRCPICAGGLAIADHALRCPGGHSFDVARQGYVNLLTGPAPAEGDSSDMVAARAELLSAGHFDFISAAIAGAVPYREGFVVDVGAGTGHYLAELLERRPGLLGLALDAAKPAARRAARAHPRMAAAVCDAWRGLPVADTCADVVLDVFAPRNGAEFRRVLHPDGRLLVVTPRPDHLAELVEALGLIGVDPDKERRLDVSLGRWFRVRQSDEYARPLALAHAAVRRLVGMGPSARHLPATLLAERIAALPEPVSVTASVRLTVYAPGGAS
jgi:23S rRNA (guanine745-N1)-methyltransferase